MENSNAPFYEDVCAPRERKFVVHQKCHELLFLDFFCACDSSSIDRTNECCRGSAQGDSRCARKSRNGHHYVPAVQWTGTKSALEMVGSRTGGETAASVIEARFSRHVRFVLPLVLERSRTGAGKVPLGDCRPCVGGSAGPRTNACDSPDALLQPGSSSRVVSEFRSAPREQTRSEERRVGKERRCGWGRS